MVFHMGLLTEKEKGAFFISSLETKLEENKKGELPEQSSKQFCKKARVFPLLKNIDISHNTDTYTYQVSVSPLLAASAFGEGFGARRFTTRAKKKSENKTELTGEGRKVYQKKVLTMNCHSAFY